MNKDFALFQKEFKKWQQLFGLTGYKVYFKYEPVDHFAKILIDLESMIATAILNSELPDNAKPFRDIKQCAKHEALHLLIARLELNGKYRYISESEIDEASEELVIRLEGLV